MCCEQVFSRATFAHTCSQYAAPSPPDNDLFAAISMPSTHWEKNKTRMPVIAAVPQRVISGTSHSHSSTSMVAFDWQGMAFNNCSVVLGLRGTVVELEAVNFSKSVRLKKKNNIKKTRKRHFWASIEPLSLRNAAKISVKLTIRSSSFKVIYTVVIKHVPLSVSFRLPY